MAAVATDARSRREKEAAVAAALLLLERRAKRGLRAAVDVPAAHYAMFRAGNAALEAAVRKSSEVAVLRLREGARASARGSWSALVGLDPVGPVVLAGDVKAADAAADSIASAWRSEVDAAEQAAEDAPLADVYGTAREAVVSAVERVAVTESFDAYNDEVVRQNNAAYARGVALTERWEAAFDDRVCDACAAMSGEERTRPDYFSRTPPLHPNCRCYLVTRLD
jgi:hypothetical protein